MPRPVTTADARRQVNAVPHLLGSRILTVAGNDRIGPAMTRVRLTGEKAGAIPFLPWAAGDHVKIVVPDPDGGLKVPPVRAERAAWDEVVGQVRDYTIRTVDQMAGTISIDAVLHDHGPAGRWFSAATPGEAVGVVGPRGSHLFPPGYRHYVLIGDETAMPALGRWLDEPGLSAAITLITVCDHDDPYPFPAPAAQIEAHHLVVPADGPRGALLAEQLAGALERDPEAFVFAAGEADALRPVRRVLREAGHPRHAAHVDGYWRTGVAGLDHHINDDD